MHEFASCFCPYQLYPYDTLCTYGVKQLKLPGFSQRHLFWCSLMVETGGLEPSTSCVWSKRSNTAVLAARAEILAAQGFLLLLLPPADTIFLFRTLTSFIGIISYGLFTKQEIWAFSDNFSHLLSSNSKSGHLSASCIIFSSSKSKREYENFDHSTVIWESGCFIIQL